MLRNAFSKVDDSLQDQKPSTIILGTLAALATYRAVSYLISSGPKQVSQDVISSVFKLVKMLPGASGAIAKEKSKMVDKVKGAFHNPFGSDIPVHTVIPEEGLPSEQIIELLKKIRVFENEKLAKKKLSGTVYIDNDEQTQLLAKAFELFIHVNPLHTETFPSGRKFESEIVRMTANMLHGDKDVVGFITSGGTESILMAVKAYRDMAKDQRGITQDWEIVASTTVHAAFEKAAHYFGCKMVYVQADPQTFVITADQVRKVISKRTIMIVGSAPNFPQGTIDPIEELSALALSKNIPFHTDACLGGFVLPFAKELGYPGIPKFDFECPGVTSMSADTHKFGLSNKGSSVLLFKNAEFRHYMYFVAPTWTGGIYASPAIAGSRAGTNLATTWSAMVHTGKKGYLESTQRIMKTAQRIKEGIREIPELMLQGDAPSMVIAFCSKNDAEMDVFKVSDAMSDRGWSLNVLQYPKGVHICITGNHYGRADEFVHDLKESVKKVRDEPESFKNGMAPIYGSAIALPDKTLITDLLGGVIDAMLDMPEPANH